MNSASFDYRKKMDNLNTLSWNVIYHDINGDKISAFNVFCHSAFVEDVRKYYRKCISKEAFAEALRRLVTYYFWSKYEWEIIIGPFGEGRSIKGTKVDVYWQILNNWDVFLDYVWNARPGAHNEKSQSNECDRETV